MASEHILNIKALLDTSDVQQKLKSIQGQVSGEYQQLQQTNTNNAGTGQTPSQDGGRFDQGKLSRSIDGLNGNIGKLLNSLNTLNASFGQLTTLTSASKTQVGYQGGQGGMLPIAITGQKKNDPMDMIVKPESFRKLLNYQDQIRTIRRDFVDTSAMLGSLEKTNGRTSGISYARNLVFNNYLRKLQPQLHSMANDQSALDEMQKLYGVRNLSKLHDKSQFGLRWDIFKHNFKTLGLKNWLNLPISAHFGKPFDANTNYSSNGMLQSLVGFGLSQQFRNLSSIYSKQDDGLKMSKGLDVASGITQGASMGFFAGGPLGALAGAAVYGIGSAGNMYLNGLMEKAKYLEDFNKAMKAVDVQLKSINDFKMGIDIEDFSENFNLNGIQKIKDGVDNRLKQLQRELNSLGIDDLQKFVAETGMMKADGKPEVWVKQREELAQRYVELQEEISRETLSSRNLNKTINEVERKLSETQQGLNFKSWSREWLEGNRSGYDIEREISRQQDVVDKARYDYGVKLGWASEEPTKQNLEILGESERNLGFEEQKLNALKRQIGVFERVDDVLDEIDLDNLARDLEEKMSFKEISDAFKKVDDQRRKLEEQLKNANRMTGVEVGKLLENRSGVMKEWNLVNRRLENAKAERKNIDENISNYERQEYWGKRSDALNLETYRRNRTDSGYSTSENIFWAKGKIDSLQMEKANSLSALDVYNKLLKSDSLNSKQREEMLRNRDIEDFRVNQLNGEQQTIQSFVEGLNLPEKPTLDNLTSIANIGANMGENPNDSFERLYNYFIESADLQRQIKDIVDQRLKMGLR